MKRHVYKKAKEFLADIVKQRDSEEGLGGLQHYAVIYEDYTLYHPNNTACYASICGKNIIRTGCDAIVSLTTKYQGFSPTMEDTGEYYEWLIKHSPFAPVFKSKNIKQAVEQGIICHTTQAMDLTGGALISARMAYETPRSVRMWTKLVRGGVDPSLAYLLMATFKEDGAVNAVYPYGGGHHCLPSGIDKEFALNFLKGTPSQERNSFRVHRGYNYNSRMWGSCNGVLLSRPLSSRFAAQYKARKTLFGGTVPAGATNQQLVEEVLSFQDTFFKENKL